tara:strand:- start:1028 stop:1624 length:597 start_codon:yes stop_codon:yes gene_type:complete
MKKASSFKLKSGNKPSIAKLMGISPMKKNGLAITLGGTGIKSGIHKDKTFTSMTINPGVRIGNLNLGYEYGTKRIGGREGNFRKIKNVTGNYRFFKDGGITGSLSGKLGTNTSIGASLGFGKKPYQSRRSCGPRGCVEMPGSRRFDLEAYGKYGGKKKGFQAGLRGRYGFLTGSAGYDFKTGKPTFMGGITVPFGKQN